MEGVYEKLIGNSGKLSALGHLICSFSNCFQKSSGSRSFFVVATGGGLKKSSRYTWANLAPGAGVRGVPGRGALALSAVLNGLSALPSQETAPPLGLPAGPWSHVAFCTPAQRFLQRKTSPGCQKAGLAAECYLKFSKCAHQQQWSYRWGEVEMKAVTRVMEIISHGDLNTEYRIILPWIRSWLPEI